MPRGVFSYVGNKTFDFSSKKKDFLPKNDQIWPKIGIWPNHAGIFGALLMGQLVVVARGLYLARHLFTLLIFFFLFFYHFHSLDVDQLHRVPTLSETQWWEMHEPAREE